MFYFFHIIEDSIEDLNPTKLVLVSTFQLNRAPSLFRDTIIALVLDLHAYVHQRSDCRLQGKCYKIIETPSLRYSIASH